MMHRTETSTVGLLLPHHQHPQDPAVLDDGHPKKTVKRQLTGLIYENILTDQEFELLEGLSRVCDIRLTHHRIFTQDKHPTNSSQSGPRNHLSGCQSWDRIKVYSPMLSKAASYVIIVNALISGENIRQSATIRAALDIVLSPKRVETGTWFSHMPTKKCQIS